MATEKNLDVRWNQELVGVLKQVSGQMIFQYADSWLQQSGAMPISQSLPLRAEPFKQRECRGFFAGILPEQGQRDQIARNLGISKQNDWALLAEIGGECAGALTFLLPGSAIDGAGNRYRPLSEGQLVDVLRELPRRPLMAGSDGIRLSLAGAQNKLAIKIEDGRVSIPLDTAPSTHILKPDHPDFKGLIWNEAFCMRLARKVGLKTAPVSIGSAGEFKYLLVERYDRFHVPDEEGGSHISRLHQEDFCQALSVVPEMKYQADSGPSLKDCFGLIRRASTVPAIDTIALLQAVCFNLIIGNCDAHAKNFSLLYRHANEREPQVGLAPLYDLISTAAIPQLSTHMAMRMGKQYDCNKVSAKDFDAFTEAAELAKPQARRTLLSLAEAIAGGLSELAAEVSNTESLADTILQRCQHLLSVMK